jgi:hypothetical protein
MEHWSLDGKTTNDWNQVGVELNKSADLLEQLKEVIEKPGYDTEFDYQTGFVDFKMAPVGPVRNAARLLSAAAMHELARGQLEPANGHLCSLVRLGALQKPEPLIIYQLIRQACAAIAFNATWQAVQADGWKDSQLRSLQSAWQRCDFITDMARAMEMERALSLEYFEQIKHSRSTLRSVIAQHEQVAEATDGGMGGLVTRGFMLHWIHAPVWRIAWADQGALFDLNEWQVIIERERIARTNGWVVLADRSKALSLNIPWAPFLQGSQNISFYDKLRLLFAEENLGISEGIIRKTLFMQAQQQMAVAAIAIDRYRLKTGHLPVTLSDLVPDYLPALPQDFMNGRPLRYRLSPADDFILYSVGEDGNDDGGDRALRKANGKYTRIWDGKDAVWPIRATSEEAARALSSP